MHPEFFWGKLTTSGFNAAGNEMLKPLDAMQYISTDAQIIVNKFDEPLHMHVSYSEKRHKRKKTSRN